MNKNRRRSDNTTMHIAKHTIYKKNALRKNEVQVQIELDRWTSHKENGSRITD